MGFFGTIKNNWEKSKAAVIVQNLLEIQQRHGFFDADPAQVANVMVEACWTKSPEMFDGRFGQRPHKLAIAAFALASCVDGMPEENRLRLPVLMSLGTLLAEVEKNGMLYPFNALDQKLLAVSGETYMELGEQMMANDRFRF